jgi:stage III sporulation protein AA
MITIKKTPFEQAADYLKPITPTLTALPRAVTDTVREIRLRAGQPVTLECDKGRIRLAESERVTMPQIAECMREFCEYSLHSYEKQLKEGWLTLSGGHRAGFTGTAVLNGGKVENVRDISSVNLRIAKQYTGCADDLYFRMFGNHGLSEQNDSTPSGLLIIGRPMSAKTTVLRDLCRLISADFKVALIDERSEVAAVQSGNGYGGGVPALDVGENTDVLNNFPKPQGIMSALRNLSPEYVVCDEIGWESGEIAALANSGVRMILTAHSGSLKDAYSSERICRILSTGAISHIALLGHGKNIGRVEFYGTSKYNGGVRGGHNGNDYGSVFFLPTENA